MFTTMCTKHRSHRVDASARVAVNSTAGMSADWRFTAKPYANQRPSGAPPG